MRNLKLLLLAGLCGFEQPAAGNSQATAPTDAAPTTRRPSIGAPPSWALKAEIPGAPAATEGAASVNLLVDRQVWFDHGTVTSYLDVARQILTPQGLADGALKIDWDPSLERLVLHRYRILRAGQSTDLLGDGNKLSIVQREENMENAALDGQLTASLQPDDLRVGDIVEYSYTRERRDPALGGHSELLTGPADGATFGRFRTRLTWPADARFQWRSLPGVVTPKLTRTAAGNELTTDLSGVRTPLAPRGAPARYRTVNAVELSDFADWRSVAQTILPYYTKATTLSPNSEVRAQAQRIAQTTADPRRRAELALELVQNQVRYLFLGMDDGGYIPAAADLTWSRRFGDCKGRTVLLVALLRELGIEAEPVLVNTEAGDFVRSRLPAMGSFDHVIVRATIGGRAYWLDGTRLGDTRLDVLRTPPYTVGLPVSAALRGLVEMKPESLTKPSETINLALDASAGIDAPATATGEMRFRGMSGTDMRVKYTGLSAADLQQQLRDLWRKNYDFVSPGSFTTGTDPATGDFVITMRGTAKMDWYSDVGARWYELDRARLGWKFDTDRTNMVSADAPFALDYPDYWESRQTIVLPSAGKGFTLQADSIDQEVQGAYAMHRKVAIDHGVVTMEASTRALAPEVPSTQVEQVRSELASLRLKGAFVRVPDDYMATEGDLIALRGDKSALADALVHRGAVLFDQGEFKASLADEDAALKLNPKLASALSVRALSLAALGDASAVATADAALAIDPKQSLAWKAKINLASKQERLADARTAWTAYIALIPDDPTAFLGRAGTRLSLGEFGGALADADAGIALKPSAMLWVARSAALLGLNRPDEALADADRAVRTDPDLEETLKFRAEVRAEAGKPQLAISDYDELIRRWPKPTYHLAKAQLRPAGQKDLRAQDIAAALRLDPKSQEAITLRAAMAIDAGDVAAARSDVARLKQLGTDDDHLIGLQTAFLEKEGRTVELLKLMNSHVARHPNDAGVLNERCWKKATLNISIETALADCNASLKLRPDSAATLDSRAFVRLRLGQYAVAISDFDAALKLSPRMPSSLFGRAIAKARQGDLEGARADLALARAQAGDVESRFHKFGIDPPAELSTSAPADPGRS